jgi:SulP family sulfate permease
LSLAATNVPDGMGDAILVGVNPLLGLYATMVGPIVGALLSSTRLMVVTTTAAASLTAGQALGNLTGTEREAELALMVIVVGAFLLLFGALRLGRLTRFVSYSVMTGFLMGVGTLIVLSQLPNVTGYTAEGGNATARFFDLLAHLDRVDLASIGLALLTLVLAVLLPRTRLGNFGILAALVVPSALAAVFGLDQVRTVSDVGTFAGGLPPLHMPSLAGGLDVVSGAFSVAVIIAVQAAGVSQNVPNPGGSHSSTSRDFAAMGVANVVAALVRGLPVGGSLSGTALSLLAGGGSRWAAGFAGLWMAVVVIGFPRVVSPIVMPALGALLVLAGARTLKPAEALSIWRTGWTSRLAIVTTFLAMLVLPIQAAIGIGVALSALLYVTQSAADVSLLERAERADGSIEETRAPVRLPSDAVTVLNVYGHLFYAGSRTLERQLPDPHGARHPVVI